MKVRRESTYPLVCTVDKMEQGTVYTVRYQPYKHSSFPEGSAVMRLEGDRIVNLNTGGSAPLDVCYCDMTVKLEPNAELVL